MVWDVRLKIESKKTKMATQTQSVDKKDTTSTGQDKVEKVWVGKSIPPAGIEPATLRYLLTLQSNALPIELQRVEVIMTTTVVVYVPKSVRVCVWCVCVCFFDVGTKTKSGQVGV